MPYAVFFSYFPYRTAGNAEGDMVIWNIPCYNASCSDYHVISDVNPSDDADARGNPDVAADVNLLGKFGKRGFSFCIKPHALCVN